MGPGAEPLARVVVGVGNGDTGPGTPTEGALAGRVVGTYLHGPVLARNPALADRLLGWALGAGPGTGEGAAGDLAPIDDAEVDALRAERLVSVRRARAARRPARR